MDNLPEDLSREDIDHIFGTDEDRPRHRMHPELLPDYYDYNESLYDEF